MSITRAFDVKLKVLPLLASCEHQYYYEGPCRFGQGDALKPGYDALANAQRQKMFMEALNAVTADNANIEIMDICTLKRTDNWDNHEDQWEAISASVAECDVVVGGAAIASDDLLVEFCTRYDKPIIISPDSYASNIGVPAAVRALHGEPHEIFSVWKWEQLPAILNSIRARKVINTTRILLATRFGSPVSQSSLDTFNDYGRITAKLGIRFRFVNIHELLDQMTPAVEGGNHTTPGRETLDLTEEDMAEAEKIAKELCDGAEEVTINHDMLLKSIYAYLTVRKHMDYKDCCGFTAPCPDVCSTRRLNEMQFTFCLTHSLNLEQGIPSACEFDVSGVASMQALMAVSGKNPYLGNTEPLTWFPGTDIPLVLGGDREQAKVLMEKCGGNKENIYFMQHSIAHRRIHDNTQDSPYAVRHFAWDQKFGATMRYDFDADAGRMMTICRFSPDGEKMLVANAECICGDGYTVPNCSQIVYFRVKDADEFFKAQSNFGLHCVMVFGDYRKELIDLCKLLKVEPVVLNYED